MTEIGFDVDDSKRFELFESSGFSIKIEHSISGVLFAFEVLFNHQCKCIGNFYLKECIQLFMCKMCCQLLRAPTFVTFNTLFRTK